MRKTIKADGIILHSPRGQEYSNAKLHQVLGKEAWATRREVQLIEKLPEKAVAFKLFDSQSHKEELLLDKSQAHILVTKKSKKAEITAAGCNAIAKQLGEALKQPLHKC